MRRSSFLTLFLVFKGVTVTTKNDLIFDDIFFMVGEGSRFRVKNGAVLSFGSGVSVVDEKTGEAGTCTLSLDAGCVAVIPEEIKDCFVIEGDGEVVIVGRKSSAAPDTSVTPPSAEPTDGTVFLSDKTGSNANDGLSAKTPKKSLGSLFGSGAAALLKEGGKLVLCGILPLGGDYVWELSGAVTMTANYGGTAYTDSALKLASRSTLTVKSDLALEDMCLVFEGAQNKIVVSGATFTVTDTVRFASGTGDTPQCSLILCDGATAVLSDAAKKIFTVENQ